MSIGLDISHAQSAGAGDVFTGDTAFGDMSFGGGVDQTTVLVIAVVGIVAGAILGKWVAR